MKNFVRIVALALLFAGLMGVAAGGANDASASNGYESWSAFDSNSCQYYWDGYTYSQSVCIRTDGGINLYLANSGTWAYIYSAWSLTDGSTAVYYQGQYYNSGQNLSLDTFIDAGRVGGGWTNVNQTLTETIVATTGANLAPTINLPTCIRWENDVCLYYGS